MIDIATCIAELAANLVANGWDETDALYEAQKTVVDQDSRAVEA